MKKARITAVFVAVFMLITSVSCAVTVSATETTQKTAYERLGDLVGDTGYFTDYEPRSTVCFMSCTTCRSSLLTSAPLWAKRRL